MKNGTRCHYLSNMKWFSAHRIMDVVLNNSKVKKSRVHNFFITIQSTSVSIRLEENLMSFHILLGLSAENKSMNIKESKKLLKRKIRKMNFQIMGTQARQISVNWLMMNQTYLMIVIKLVTWKNVSIVIVKTAKIARCPLMIRLNYVISCTIIILPQRRVHLSRMMNMKYKTVKIRIRVHRKTEIQEEQEIIKIRKEPNQIMNRIKKRIIWILKIRTSNALENWVRKGCLNLINKSKQHKTKIWIVISK